MIYGFSDLGFLYFLDFRIFETPDVDVLEVPSLLDSTFQAKCRGCRIFSVCAFDDPRIFECFGFSAFGIFIYRIPVIRNYHVLFRVGGFSGVSNSCLFWVRGFGMFGFSKFWISEWFFLLSLGILNFEVRDFGFQMLFYLSFGCSPSPRAGQT